MKFLLKFLFYSLLIGTLAGVTIVVTAYYTLTPKLPSIDILSNIHYQVPLQVLAEDGKLIAEFGEKHRIPVEIKDIPKQIIQAVIASEDENFYSHIGVDPKGLIRAAVKYAITGKKKQGGSTITMQVARNFFLTRKKTISRKIKEIFLSIKIEQKLSKETILQLYLNKIFLGHRAYGIGSAAQVYYGKPLKQLNLAQLAMLAGLPKAPSAYNPVTNAKRAIIRRNYVLERMLKLEFITNTEFIKAKKAPVTASIHTTKPDIEAPYIAEMVRSYMLEKFGKTAYTQGYKVTTTISSDHQQYANNALQQALLQYDERHGYRGAEKNILIEDTSIVNIHNILKHIPDIKQLKPAYVISIKDKAIQIQLKNDEIVNLNWDSIAWARQYITPNKRGPKPKKATDILKIGDIIRIKPDDKNQWKLTQIPQIEGAIVALKPNNGAISALTGGFNFYQSKYNRVTQAQRQPGSGFKPFIYSAALEKGYTPATLINDAPVVFGDKSLESTWRPENYSGKSFGPTRLRIGLAKSRNLISIRILRDIKVRYAAKYASHFGFDYQSLPKNLSLSLGSGTVKPIEQAVAYSSFANGGYKIEHYFIKTIENELNQIIYTANPITVCKDECLAEAEKNNLTDETIELTNKDIQKEKSTPVYAQQIITPQNNFIINSILRDVIRYGTGRRAKKLGRKVLAGKTGTTNDQKDAWFNGFHPSLVAICWIGFDETTPLGNRETGGKAALPMWMDFMKNALKNTPHSPLKQPEKMVTVRIDKKTGLLASSGGSKSTFETFRIEYVPKKKAPNETKKSARIIIDNNQQKSISPSNTTIDNEVFW